MGSPYAYTGDQWIGFDDQRSIEKKVRVGVGVNGSGASSSDASA